MRRRYASGRGGASGGYSQRRYLASIVIASFIDGYRSFRRQELPTPEIGWKSDVFFTRWAVRYLLMFLALATSAASTAAQVPAGREVPARKTIEKIEADIAFWSDAEAVGMPGVIGASDAGRRWRVRVRRLVCQPSETGAMCSYEAKPCFDALSNDGSPAWCARQRRFQHGGGFVEADGWIVAAAQ